MDLPSINIISLCSGIGGLDLGVSRALRGLGYEPRVVAYVEGEAYAASILAKQMEAGELDKAPIWSDVKTFPCEIFSGRVDCIIGGYPCQPFSVAGKRLGKEDPRHLWPYVMRVLIETGASLLFCENVRGHVSRGLGEVLGQLSCLRFNAEWDIFSAEEEGAPHRRERLFILAHTDSAGQSVPDRFARIEGGGTPETGAEGIPEGGGRGTNKHHAVPLNAGETLADANSEGQLQPEGTERTQWGRTCNSGEEIPDANHPGRLQQRGSSPVSEEHPATQRSSGWTAEPNVGRVANGVSNRVDRIRALGNAVVPQCAERAFSELWDRCEFLSESLISKVEGPREC